MNGRKLLLALCVVTALLQGVNVYGWITRWYAANRASSGRSQGNLQDLTVEKWINLEGLPIKGGERAKVVVVEFSDYECPFCARHANGVGLQVEKEFVTTGLVKYAFVNNPLSIHPNARNLAVSAVCAGEQGQYWQMHDSLFRTRPNTQSELKSLVAQLGIEPVEYQSCMEKSSVAELRIDADLNQAEVLQLTKTPSFAIGVIGEGNRARLQKVVVGASPFGVFAKAIGDVLAKAQS